MRERLLPILEANQGHKESLIPVLQKVQGELGYLPEESLSEIAHFLGLSSSEIFGVASFYAQFRFERQGEHTIKVCQGTACHVRGAKRIMEAVAQELNVEPGGTTADYKFSLEQVACFGCCALAPVLVIDGQVHGRMTTSGARKVLEDY
ncbi:MAG TPA: NADH-quinone oxidoreductase subunit NuoE [Dehalococcoidia bacterium]|nr:NADH-quinone oxidoreductase subunit NuoE [Dehalococcoidia bacterium]